jgi:hypothetical protein
MGRLYKTRKGEFFDLSIDQLKEQLEVVSKEFSAIQKEQKTNKTEENELKRKELNNKRIRLYARMRKLDYRASEFRGNKSPVKVEPIVSPETRAKLDEIAKQKEAEDARTKQEITADHALDPEKRTAQLEKQEEQPPVQEVPATNTLIVSNRHSNSDANKRIILSLKQ